MKAEIIAVGSELLLGQIPNINAQTISNALREIGIDVYYHVCVGDNKGRL
ncbi:MAG: molybdopterin-binding protein, partial [Tepidanaerobacteraceae bacterium]|nr:molybdopterin-binding protein [Tepidanaerobacteraceae bacterium]